MLSNRAKVQIGYQTHFRQRRSDHEHTIQIIIGLIRDGEITHSGEVRELCKELGWRPKPIQNLCDMVDDVGLTLLATGTIDRW